MTILEALDDPRALRLRLRRPDLACVSHQERAVRKRSDRGSMPARWKLALRQQLAVYVEASQEVDAGRKLVPTGRSSLVPAAGVDEQSFDLTAGNTDEVVTLARGRRTGIRAAPPPIARRSEFPPDGIGWARTATFQDG